MKVICDKARDCKVRACAHSEAHEHSNICALSEACHAAGQVNKPLKVKCVTVQPELFESPKGSAE